jgi:hypothetical protein
MKNRIAQRPTFHFVLTRADTGDEEEVKFGVRKANCRKLKNSFFSITFYLDIPIKAQYFNLKRYGERSRPCGHIG